MLYNCAECGKDFNAKPREKRKFCNRACWKLYESKHGRPANVVQRLTFNCQTCGNEFTRKPGQIAQYHARFGRDPNYCSSPCWSKGRIAATVERKTFVCKCCGKTSPIGVTIMKTTGRRQYNNAQQFCNLECKYEHNRQTAADRFIDGKIGRHVKRHGYVWISIPANVSSTGKKREMLEHRYVMEQHIGRPLTKDETVHHINGQRSQNNIENLELFSSRHGPGQRVTDKIDFAVEMITRYPEFVNDANRSALIEALEHHIPLVSRT